MSRERELLRELIEHALSALYSVSHATMTERVYLEISNSLKAILAQPEAEPAPAAGETLEVNAVMKYLESTETEVSRAISSLLRLKNGLERQNKELRSENERLAAHALAIEESVKRIKEKAAAEHKDHPFCPHCSPCRHGEKLAELTAENERLRNESEGALPCCSDFENCNNRCIPLANHWKNTAQRLRQELEARK